MSTCAELPQFGCCDVVTLRPPGFYGIVVNDDFGSPETPLGVNLGALVETMRLKIAALQLPTTPNTANFYSWDYAGELRFLRTDAYPANGSAIGTGFTVSGRVSQILAGTRIYPVFPSNNSVINGGRAMAVTRQTIVPSCVGDITSIPSQNRPHECIAPRITSSANTPFGNAFEFRVDTGLGEVEILCPPLDIRGQKFRFGTWATSEVFLGSVPSCCDLSAMPP